MKKFKLTQILLLLFAAFGFFGAREAGATVDLDYPASGARCVPMDAIFQWSYDGTGGKTVAANGYDFLLSKSATFASDTLEDETGLSSGTFTTAKLEYNTVYYWRATIHFTDVTLEQTSGSFTTDGPPTLSIPGNDALCVDYSAPTFIWNPRTAADGYTLYIATSSTFGPTTIQTHNIAGGSSSTFTADPLNENTQYWWRMTADYSSLCGSSSTFSVTRTFKTEADPPTLVTPADNYGCLHDGDKFDWSDVSGAAYYEIQYHTSSTFTVGDPQIISNIESSTFSMPVGSGAGDYMDYDRDYWWRVRAVFTPGCKTDWSAIRKVSTAVDPPQVDTPMNGAQGVGLTPTLSWTVSTEPVHYYLQVSAESDFSSLIYDVNSLAPSSTYTGEYTLDDPGKPLTINTVYYWRVRSNFTGCSTEWTSASFTTYYPQVILSTPLNDESCVSLTQRFVWAAVPGADAYRVQISKNADMTDPVIDASNIGDIFYDAVLTSGNTVYYWRVRAEDDNNYGLWSDIRHFTTTNDAPALQLPADSTFDVDVADVTFQWASAGSGAKYFFQLDTDPGFSNPLVDLSGLTVNKTVQTLDEYYQVYYWRVKVILNGCESAWSEPFMITTGLPAPTLLIPADNSIKQPILPVFRWENSPGATAYQIELAPNANFLPDETIMGTEASTNTISSSVVLQEFTSYYWRVKAKNERGESPWSATFTFKTGEKGPDPVVKISPDHRTEDLPTTVTLKWHKAARATSYNLQVSGNEQMTIILYDLKNLTDTTYELTNLKHLKIYYWTVQAVNEAGVSSWGPVWQFSTIVAPPQEKPNLVTPPNMTQGLAEDVTFTWDNVLGAQYYQLQIAEDPTFPADNLTEDIDKISTSFKVVYGLQPNTTYYWRVRAKNKGGSGGWSDIWRFQTGGSSVLDQFRALYKTSVVPNPFTDQAYVNFVLPDYENVTIKVYNLLGEEVGVILNNKALAAGEHSLPWNPAGLQSGVYIVTIQIQDYKDMMQVILTR